MDFNQNKIGEGMKREFNPETSSLTASQQRTNAYEFKTCSDGKRCGVPPSVGDDAYCADCPNVSTAEEEAEFARIQSRQEAERPHEADARMLDAQLAADISAINPGHYRAGNVECIEALASATINKRGIESICTANIIKYLWRYEQKNGIEDVRKAQWYLNRLLTELEK